MKLQVAGFGESGAMRLAGFWATGDPGSAEDRATGCKQYSSERGGWKKRGRKGRFRAFFGEIPACGGGKRGQRTGNRRQGSEGRQGGKTASQRVSSRRSLLAGLRSRNAAVAQNHARSSSANSSLSTTRMGVSGTVISPAAASCRPAVVTR